MRNAKEGRKHLMRKHKHRRSAASKRNNSDYKSQKRNQKRTDGNEEVEFDTYVVINPPKIIDEAGNIGFQSIPRVSENI